MSSSVAFREQRIAQREQLLNQSVLPQIIVRFQQLLRRVAFACQTLQDLGEILPAACFECRLVLNNTFERARSLILAAWIDRRDGCQQWDMVGIANFQKFRHIGIQLVLLRCVVGECRKCKLEVCIC